MVQASSFEKCGRLASEQADAAARAGLVRYGRVRLALSWLFEAMLQPFLPLARTDNRQDGEPRNILVIEYWNLGDFVMLTPFLKNLRLHFPQAHIALLGSPRTISMAQGQGLVDEVIPVRVPWAQHMGRRKKYISRHWLDLFRGLREVRARRFDLGFTARADIRDSFLLWAGRVRRRVGYGFAHGRSLLTDVVAPDVLRPHYSDRWLRLLEHLGKPIVDRLPELKVGPEGRAFAKKFLREKGLDDTDVLIGFHTGARNKVRQWGREKFIEVARKLTESLPVKVLWFQDPDETTAPNGNGFVPVKLPLKNFLAVLAECKTLICNDTGPMHMASGLGVPVVAVFGPTQPEWFAPLGEHHKIVIRREMWCRPCFDYCVFDQPYCLHAISAESVFETAMETINRLMPKRERAALVGNHG